MAGDSHKNSVRIFNVNRDLPNLLAVAQSFKVCPRLARIGGLVDTIAGREIWPLQTLCAGNIDDVRLALGHGNGPDRAGRLTVPYAVPRRAGISRLPDTAVHGAQVKGGWLTGNAGQRTRTTRSHRANLTPLHVRIKLRIDLGVCRETG